MNSDERTLLEGLFARLRQADQQPRDAEAERFIADAVSAQPSAPYYLAQAVLVQDHALTAAQQRIQELEKAVQAARGGERSGSFLSGGGLPGGGPWGSRPGTAAPARAAPAAPYAAAGPAAAPVAGPSAYAPPAGGGFLHQALTTAAGVAGGALLFEGISSLFHQSPGPFGGGLGGYPGAMPGPQVVEDTVVNNYYDDPRGGAATSADAGPADDRPEADAQQADYDPGGNDPFGSDASDTADDQWSDGGGDSYT